MGKKDKPAAKQKKPRVVRISVELNEKEQRRSLWRRKKAWQTEENKSSS